MSPSGEDLGMGETSAEGAKIIRLLNTTSETGTFEGRAGGFTVPSHWPLGQPARVLLLRRAQGYLK